MTDQTHRSLRAWSSDDNETSRRLRSEFARQVHTPSPDEMAAARPELDSFLRSADVLCLVPMREPEDPQSRVPGDTLSYLLDDVGMPSANVLVLDQGSAEGPRRRAIESGASVLATADPARALAAACSDWTAAEELPVGKGLNVLCGVLHAALRPEPPRWVLLADADLRRSSDFARHLAWPLLERPCAMSVATHVGRNNESVLAVRAALSALSSSRFLPGPERASASALWEDLCGQVHLLAGERILDFGVLASTPLASGYSLEVCLAIHALRRHRAGQGDPCVQTVNTLERRDIPNGASVEQAVQAEQRMMYSIGRTLVLLATHRQGAGDWDLDELRRVNLDLAAMPAAVPQLPVDAGPMEAVPLPAERFLPSVRTLLAGALIDPGLWRSRLQVPQ